MLLNRNIKERDKNAPYYLMIGIIFLGMSAWVYLSEGQNGLKGLDAYNWTYLVVFAIAGIYFTVKGLKSLLQKAYIRVNDTEISVKSDGASKADTIQWTDIQSIQSFENQFVILKKDQTNVVIRLSYLNYENADELKQAIFQTALAKGIPIEKE